MEPNDTPTSATSAATNGKPNKGKPTAPAQESGPTTDTALVAPVVHVAIEPVLTATPDGTPTFRVVSAMGPEEAAELLHDAALTAYASGLTPRQAAREAAKVYRAKLTKAVDALIAARRGRK